MISVSEWSFVFLVSFTHGASEECSLAVVETDGRKSDFYYTCSFRCVSLGADGNMWLLKRQEDDSVCTE